MFLKIKKIPKVYWSSEKPYNFRPKFSTFFFLCFGLTLFGLGEGLLIVSFTGASPWSVLAQGISLNINLSIGTITLLISIAVLILWIPLGLKPGIGTIFNALIIALMIDFCIKFDTRNSSLKDKLKIIEEKTKKNIPTIPTTIADEIRTNIFLRCKDLNSFSKLRELKDNF